jgi:pyruvate kinase
LQQDIVFSELDGLKGKFKGIKPKKTVVKKGASVKKSRGPEAKKTTKKPAKRDKTFYKTVAVGDQVFMPKKKASKPTPPSSEE